ncbi:MAG: thioesterase domain-containing protein, partial [Nostoc sp.]|uniref:thioesterase domain-containing protein n=1 Tax=Nostoc sp. TaxID=1180 RepID=UPI002FF6EE11
VTDFVPPRTPTEEIIANIFADVLGIEAVGINDNFFELGGNSLLAVRLVARIRQQFGKELQLSTLFQEATIEHLATILRQQNDPCTETILVRIQPTGSRQPFFCVHPAGGNVLCYADLARCLGQDQPFYGLQAVGFDGKQEPYPRIEVMAARYIEVIQLIQPEGPYLLGGWSFGGIVAFEMAQQLQAKGQKVALLALFDAIAMNSTIEFPENDPVLLAGFAQDLGLSLESFEFATTHFRQLQSDEQLTYVFERAKTSNLLPLDIELSQVHSLFHVFKTNVRAISNYLPQVYPGQVTLFRATEQFADTPQNPTNGWSRLAKEGVEIQVVPGNHYNMLRKPHVKYLAEQLKTYLDKTQTFKSSHVV